MQDFCKNLCRGLSVWVSSHSPETSRITGEAKFSTCERERDGPPQVSARWWTAHLSGVNPPLTQCQLGLAPVCRNPAEVTDDRWMAVVVVDFPLPVFVCFPTSVLCVLSSLFSCSIWFFASHVLILTILPVFTELHPLWVFARLSVLNFGLYPISSFFCASIFYLPAWSLHLGPFSAAIKTPSRATAAILQVRTPLNNYNTINHKTFR